MLILSACSSLIERQTTQFTQNLATSIRDSDDPELVRSANPTFILLTEAMIRQAPDNPELLRTGATLYSAYALLLPPRSDRAKKYSERALNYALQANCLHNRSYCRLRHNDFAEFSKQVDSTGSKDVAYLYTLGSSWLGHIQSHSDDWETIIELPRARKIIERVVSLDSGYEHGGAHLYLGVLHTLLPRVSGGNPTLGRTHFERAIAFSGGRNLMAKVVYARSYGRLVFDKELHHRLLIEVVEADPKSTGFTLINVLAQQQAAELLRSEDDYF